MGRNCRLPGRTGFAPVGAAEVLEVRDLLSSAAAAVHNATHHAASQHAADPAATHGPQAPAFHGTVTAILLLNGAPAAQVPASFSMSKATLAVGAKVKATFSLSFSVGATTESVKGTFSGTIGNIAANGQGTLLQIDPNGGSVTVSVKTGKTTAKATAIPAGSFAVQLSPTSTFLELNADDVFNQGSGSLSGKTLTIDLVPQ